MKLYADPITVNCRKVMAGLDFLGAPYERVHVDYFKSEQKSPAYLAINPNASLPALVDAVLDALRPLGITHLNMPLTPAKIWAAIQNSKT